MATTIEARIQGSNTGQIAVGEHILQVNSVYGDLVTVAGERIVPRARPLPVFLRPRPIPRFIDRDTEVATAWQALSAGIPVEFYGDEGVGKTAAVRHMAHHPSVSAFADGVIFLPGNRSVDDLLQSLFDVLFESDIRYKPSDGEIRRSIANVQAGIMLDDLNLVPDEVDVLMDAAPVCTFLFASTQRHLRHEGRVILLEGFARDHALVLVQDHVGRALTPADQQAFDNLVAAVRGNPRRLLEAVDLPQEGARLSLEEVNALPSPPPRTLADVARIMAADASAQALDARMVETVSPPERRALTTLAALADVPVANEHVAALADLDQPAPVLAALERRQLVEAHDNQYRLVKSVRDVIGSDPEAESAHARAIAYFATIAENRQRTPDRLVPDHDVIVHLARSALDSHESATALRLVRAVEGSIALVGHWALWEQVLEWGLQAARRLEDRASEAWALHQLGTRALCLGEVVAASTLLNEALHTREALGDEIGAQVTRHNLNLLKPLVHRSQWSDSPTAVKVALAALVAVLLLFAGSAVAMSQGWNPFSTAPTSTPTAQPPITSTSQPTSTAVASPAPTSTSPPIPSTSTPAPPTQVIPTLTSTPPPVSPTFTPTPGTSDGPAPTSTPQIVPPRAFPVASTPTATIP